MHVLIDGEAIREDISTDDMEKIAIASLMGRTHAAVTQVVEDLVATAQEWAPRDSEFEVDRGSIVSELVYALTEWIADQSEEEKKALVAKMEAAA